MLIRGGRREGVGCFHTTLFEMLEMLSIFNLKVFFTRVFSSSEFLQSYLAIVPSASIRRPEPLQLQSRWISLFAAEVTVRSSPLAVRRRRASKCNGRGHICNYEHSCGAHWIKRSPPFPLIRCWKTKPV